MSASCSRHAPGRPASTCSTPAWAVACAVASSVLGGAPGVGKTTLALQMATAVARAGSLVSYLCYEHSEQELLTRLLLMEAGLGTRTKRRVPGPPIGRLETPQHRPAAGVAVAAVRGYGDRLRLVRGAGVGERPSDLHVLPDGERRCSSSTTCRRSPAGSRER